MKSALEALKVGMELLQHHVHGARSCAGDGRPVATVVIASSRSLGGFALIVGSVALATGAEDVKHVDEVSCSRDCKALK
jgi:hypothetical protein